MSKAQTDVVAALRIELDATKAALAKAEARTKRLADDALVALAGARIATPEKGYLVEPHCLGSDIATLARERDKAREDLSHALHSLDETKQCCDERRTQTERAEKAEAACAALYWRLREYWVSRSAERSWCQSCRTERFGVNVASETHPHAPSCFLASLNPGEGWVSPEAHAKVVDLHDDALRQVVLHSKAVGVAERERDEARAERDALTKQVGALGKITRAIDTPALVDEMLKSEEFAKLYGDSIKELEAERDSLRERLGDAERVIEALREVGSPLVARTVADFDAKWGKR